jgi:hypothetical protein
MFKINVKNACTLTSIQIPAAGALDRSIDVLTITTAAVSLLDWTQPSQYQSICPTIVYEVTDQATSTAPDTAVFTISQTKISSYTTDNNKLGVYTLNVKASIGSYYTTTYAVKVTVTNVCMNEVVITSNTVVASP